MQDAYWLPIHLRAAPVRDGIVLLNLSTNQYFGIGLKESQAVRRAVNWPAGQLVAGADDCTDVAPALVEKLIARGILTGTQPPSASFTESSIDLEGALATASQDPERRTVLTLSHLWLFIKSLRWAKRSLKRKKWIALADEVWRMKASAGAEFDTQRATELVDVFRRIRPYFFQQTDQCLFHSLALTRFLSAYGVHPVWVVGVKTKPWGAHSWVQFDNLLLDAYPEEVAEFQVILSV